MKPKYARLMATLVMALFPFITAWTLVLFTANYITHINVFSSGAFWTLAVIYWFIYLGYEYVSSRITARQREQQSKSDRASEAFEKFIKELKQQAERAHNERAKADRN